MTTKIRVLEFVTDTYLVQRRERFGLFWHNVADQEFQEELDDADIHDYIDFEDIAVRCAVRVATQLEAEYIGVVYKREPLIKRWKNRIRYKLTGPPGPCGMMGAPGANGVDGIARGALDLQCPKCQQFLQDEPRQELKVKIVQGNHFYHDCAKCGWGAKWRIVNGLPIPLAYMRK